MEQKEKSLNKTSGTLYKPYEKLTRNDSFNYNSWNKNENSSNDNNLFRFTNYNIKDRGEKITFSNEDNNTNNDLLKKDTKNLKKNEKNKNFKDDRFENKPITQNTSNENLGKEAYFQLNLNKTNNENKENNNNKSNTDTDKSLEIKKDEVNRLIKELSTFSDKERENHHNLKKLNSLIFELNSLLSGENKIMNDDDNLSSKEVNFSNLTISVIKLKNNIFSFLDKYNNIANINNNFVHKLKSYKENVDHYYSEVEKLNLENGSIFHSLDEEKKKNNELNKKITEFEYRFKEYSEKYIYMENKLLKFEEEKNDTIKQLNEVIERKTFEVILNDKQNNSNLTALKEEIERLEKFNLSLKEKVNNFIKTNNELETKEKSLEDEVLKLRENIDFISSSNKKFKLSEENLFHEIEKLKKSIDNLKNEKDTLLTQNKELRYKFEENLNLIENMQEEKIELVSYLNYIKCLNDFNYQELIAIRNIYSHILNILKKKSSQFKFFELDKIWDKSERIKNSLKYNDNIETEKILSFEKQSLNLNLSEFKEFKEISQLKNQYESYDKCLLEEKIQSLFVKDDNNIYELENKISELNQEIIEKDKRINKLLLNESSIMNKEKELNKMEEDIKLIKLQCEKEIKFINDENSNLKKQINSIKLEKSSLENNKILLIKEIEKESESKNLQNKKFNNLANSYKILLDKNTMFEKLLNRRDIILNSLIKNSITHENLKSMIRNLLEIELDLIKNSQLQYNTNENKSNLCKF